MNPLNYGSLEACKRLVEAGIVLETDAYHRCWCKESEIVYKQEKESLQNPDSSPRDKAGVEYLPAPSMTEVWRELPALYQDRYIYLTKIRAQTQVGYGWPYKPNSFVVGQNANPADALIDLLIWVRKEKV